MQAIVTLEGSLIDLYTWTTPNGRKVSIMLEETGLPYRTHAVDINNGSNSGPSSWTSIQTIGFQPS